MVVVEDDGVLDPPLLDGHLDVLFELLELEFGRVNADDHEAGVFVLLVPFLDERQRADAVDAGVGPEVDEDDLVPAQFFQHERFGVYEGTDAGKVGREQSLAS